MAKKPTKWREYQEEVAQYFRCHTKTAEVEAAVEGVRAVHDIDVWVTFQEYGVDQRWVVECKRYDTARVSKDKVLTLAQIMEDVGANAGFVLSETGFQSGALKAARKTSIQLTSLEELRRRGEPEILRRMEQEVSVRISDLRARGLRELRRRGANPPFDQITGNIVVMLQQLDLMDSGLNELRSGKEVGLIGQKTFHEFTGEEGNPFGKPVVSEVHVPGLINALAFSDDTLTVYEQRFALMVGHEPPERKRTGGPSVWFPRFPSLPAGMHPFASPNLNETASSDSTDTPPTATPNHPT